MPNEELEPLESDDTWRFDQQTATYQGRAVTSAAAYRSQSNPSNFEPAPSAPQPDPQPSADADDISPLESNKVSHYDALSKTHQADAVTEAGRFQDELEDYADYYEESTGQQYQMPVSEVDQLDVTDDQNEDPLQSNLVGDYDSASGGYGAISVAAATRAGARDSSYDQYLASAEARLDALDGNNGTIHNSFSSAGTLYQQKYSQDRQGTVTNRNLMSVLEAIDADTNSMSNSWNTSMNSTYSPNLTSFNSGVSDSLDDAVTYVQDHVIHIDEIEQDLPTG